MRWQPRASRGEQGTSLVLALAFMTLFGVSAGLLAQFGAVSFKTVAAVRDQRASSYAAEGAVDTAIANVRGNTSLGTNGGSCPQVNLPVPSGHTNVYATCTGQPSAVGGVNASLPGQALLTTATGSEDGITVGSVLGLFPGAFDVSGGVFSNSDITANQSLFGPDILDAGSNPVSARGSCTGTIRGNPIACNLGASGHPEGNDPNYPSPLSSVPTHQTVPACPSSGNKVIPFTPGFYDDEAGLNALTSGGCHNAVLWFQPGAYYFDFDWRAGDTAATWTIDDSTVDVVGGDPKGWSPTSPSRPSIPTPSADGSSGACKAEKDTPNQGGVQFVFGGDSRMQGISADIELCATPDANGRELAIYGQKTGALAPTPPTKLDPPSGSAGYTGLSNWPAPSPTALTLLDQGYTTSSSVGRNSSASITTRGYPTSSFPAIADFGSVTMKIVHHESTPTKVSGISAVVTANGTTCGTLSLTPSSSDKTETFTGSQLSCINDLSDLSNLTVKYTGQVANSNGASSTFSLDGIEFSVTYTPPALRAESGCVTQVGGCDLVLLSSSFNGSFYVNGTVYAPLARFDLEFGLSTRVRLSRGTIVRSIGLWDPPTDSSTTPIISVPPSGRTVVFIGNVDNARRVRAVVNFVDNPTPGAQVDVTGWSVTR